MIEPNASGHSEEAKLSKASASRFSLYLRHLDRLTSEGVQKISSSQLGQALDISDAQIRKDLANLGSLGQPGIGYNARELIQALRQRLGIDRTWAVVIVGVGNLARALLRYQGFRKQGFNFVALFDSDPQKIGQSLEGLQIHDLNYMPAIVRQTRAELGVLAVPTGAAQMVADALVQAGIQGILNFAPTVIRLPPGVSNVGVDLAVQLEQLAFQVHLAHVGQKEE